MVDATPHRDFGRFLMSIAGNSTRAPDAWRRRWPAGQRRMSASCAIR